MSMCLHGFAYVVVGGPDMIPFDLIGSDRYEDGPFSIPCPHCGGPAASYEPKETRFLPSKASEVAVDLGGADPTACGGTVFGFCRCHNRECQEAVYFLGTFSTEYNELETGLYRKFVIQFFFPAVPLIPIPPRTPDKVAALLKRSFAPAFSDQSASGSILRKAIERLLTELGVARFKVVDGKRKSIMLDGRIQSLPTELASYKDRLLASKWVGNAATHDELSTEELKTLYRIVADILEDLYGTEKKELLRAVKRINRRKGL